MTVRYLTPHNKWSIHSEYQDNLFMLSLSRGGQTIWMSDKDAAKVGVEDNDWIEAVNRNGVVVARAIVSHRMPEGTVYMHHAQDRLIDVPLAETSGKRGGIHNSLTRLLVKPSHLIGGYAQLSFAFNYLGPTGNQRDEVTVIRRRSQEVSTDVKVMAQMAMVMNLDKCIGCHTCSVTCKQAWTNRTGTEYVWFNNVETRPGQGYPRRYEDQEKWQGGWTLNQRGRLDAQGAAGGCRSCSTIFSNPKMPSIQDYYEPWTYDYDTLTDAPAQEHTPVARPKSLLTGKDMKIAWSANWDDNLGGSAATAEHDPMLAKIADKVKFEFEQTFMFYLPRICEHCLNPSCAASCPSGAIYKRAEDGIVLVDQDRCRGWRMCVSGCPYKKVYFNHRTGKAEKCTFCFPRIEVGLPTVCSETCVGRLRYIGLMLYDADQVLEAASTDGRARPLRGAARGVPRPERPGGRARGRAGRHPARLDRGRPALADPRADQPVQGRAAAAPGVPHDADGLVHPAALAGRRRRPGHRRRRRGRGQPVRRHRRAADPDRVPRRAVHRRRRRARSTGCSGSSPRCAPTCATSTWAASRTRRSRPRSA